jgi:predicted patatin/cPLA2 family phospholipase
MLVLCSVPAGQPAGLDIYTDHLAAGSRFLSLKRYWSSHPVMDLDFLLDEVMADTIPLDFQAVINSELPLKVVASSLTTLTSEILTDFTDRRDLAECLKASANVPEIVGGPRTWRGHDLVDAAVFEPLPIKAALRDGCTHVLALCSRTHSAGPAWGKYLTNALSSAVKYMLLNPVRGLTCWLYALWVIALCLSQLHGQSRCSDG